MRRLFYRHHPALRMAALLVLGMALAGCGPGAAWALALVALVGTFGLSLTGCAESHEQGRPDATVPRDAPIAIDAPILYVEGGPADDDGGTWERCCEDGRAATCLCPPGAICNYGMEFFCEDGTCGFPEDGEPWSYESVCADRDGGIDAGSFEPCCVEGRVESCFCPAGVECNYGLFEDCGEGRCALPGDACLDAAAD